MCPSDNHVKCRRAPGGGAAANRKPCHQDVDGGLHIAGIGSIRARERGQHSAVFFGGAQRLRREIGVGGSCSIHRCDDSVPAHEIGQAKGTGDRRIRLGDDIGSDGGRAGTREYRARLHGCEGGQHVEVQVNRAAIGYANRHEVTGQVEELACRFVHVIGASASVAQLGKDDADITTHING